MLYPFHSNLEFMYRKIPNLIHSTFHDHIIKKCYTLTSIVTSSNDMACPIFKQNAYFTKKKYKFFIESSNDLIQCYGQKSRTEHIPLVRGWA